MCTLNELNERLEMLIEKRDTEIKRFGQARLKLLNQISRTRQIIKTKEPKGSE